MTSLFRALLVATAGIASSMRSASHRHPQPSARYGPVRRSVETAALASESRSNELTLQHGLSTLHDGFSRPGLDDMQRLLSEYELSDGNRRATGPSSEPLPRWFVRLFGTTLSEQQEAATVSPEEAKMFQKTWRTVRNALPGWSGSLGIAREATALLAGWATHNNNKRSTVRLRLARGLAIAKYIGQTPYGDDGTVVAAALLCEAHESALFRGPHEAVDGLRLDDVRKRIGDEAAELLQALSNLEQLLELQRLQWDAKGHGCANANQTSSDAMRDDELLYSCRLPATHAENLLYMVVAMTGELRALPIMLARRLEALRDECTVQREAGGNRTTPSSLARDVLDVYAPLAARFGLYTLKNDLEDAAFERLAPVARARILHALNATCDERATVLQDVSTRLRRLMIEDDVLMNSVDSLRVSTREKEPYSVWRKQRKLREQRQEVAQSVETVTSAHAGDDTEVLLPLDTVAFRIVLEPHRGVDDTAAQVAAGERLCYRALSLVRSTWPAVPNRTKDYVDKPKPNGYQSLHTTVLMRLHGVSHPFEVQIRTYDMHLVAEYGSAAHERYSRLWPPQDQIYAAPDVNDKLVAELKADLARSADERSQTRDSRRRPRQRSATNFHAAPTGIIRRPRHFAGSGTVHDNLSRSSRDDHNGALTNAANLVVNFDEPFGIRYDPRPLDHDPATAGAKFAKSLSDRLRAERVFVIVSSGRVVKVSASSNGILHCHGALMKDMEADAELQGDLPANPESPVLRFVHINGKIYIGYLDILDAKVQNCDQIRFAEELTKPSY